MITLYKLNQSGMLRAVMYLTQAEVAQQTGYTLAAPPEPDEGMVAVWNAVGQEWVQKTAMPPQVNPFTLWDTTAWAWIDPRDLTDIKVMQWGCIKAFRDKRKASGVRVGSYWFHSDADSRTQQIGLVLFGANLPAGILWKTLGGAFVPMTQALAAQIFSATAINDQATFAAAEAHKAALEVSADPANYNYTSGWPPTYGE